MGGGAAGGFLLRRIGGEAGLQGGHLHTTDAGHGGPVLVRQLADDPVVAEVHQPHGGLPLPVQRLAQSRAERKAAKKHKR